MIDVKREDGEKLIESGKADFISTEESRQFKSEEGLDGLQEEAKAEDVSEEGAVEEAKAEDVSEEGAVEEKQKMYQEGAEDKSEDVSRKVL